MSARSVHERSEAQARAADHPIAAYRTVGRVETEDETWARQRRAGEPAWRISALLAIAAYQRAGGPTEQVTTTVEELTGRPPLTFEQFARDHAAELET